MNPFEIQKKMFEEWERNLASYLEKTMRQPEFMQLVGRNLEMATTLQGAVKGHVQKALKALSVPTEEELTGLYRTVNDLETRMLDLEEQLEDLAPPRAAAPAAAPAPQVKRAASKQANRKAGRKPAAAKKPAARKPAATKPAAKKTAPRKRAPSRR